VPGRQPAARAIADAMPLLERAGSIEVVIVANEHRKQDDIEGVDMSPTGESEDFRDFLLQCKRSLMALSGHAD
jgi:hypothetical protein